MDAKRVAEWREWAADYQTCITGDPLREWNPTELLDALAEAKVETGRWKDWGYRINEVRWALEEQVEGLKAELAVCQERERRYRAALEDISGPMPMLEDDGWDDLKTWRVIALGCLALATQALDPEVNL